MNKTPYYDLPVYEPNDSPNLIDGYNKAVLTIDAEIHAIQNELDLIKIRLDLIESKEV